MNNYFLGFDLGSSFVKASLVDADSGSVTGTVAVPDREMEIVSRFPGWAEQDPNLWWRYVTEASRLVLQRSGVKPVDVSAIGISYQMHGLVIVDRQLQVLRPSIIWCDSRAVGIGDRANLELGEDYCLGHLLNSPGNFTASKLKWVRENEPGIYDRIFKAFLPGDYIAMKMTGEVSTTASGLSEGVLWDYKENRLASQLLSYFEIDSNLLADPLPTFSIQGKLTSAAASELGLAAGTPIAYRAGDQPNNALSLNALKPGDLAATAGTSGVIYAVTDKLVNDRKSRVNTFLHVNHSNVKPRLGVLLCVNGAGSWNSWLRKTLAESTTYDEMNAMATRVPAGSEGLIVLPFGNGAERIFENREIGASVHGMNVLQHGLAHLCRATQEGIVFAMAHGFQILRDLGINPGVIRSGKANLFCSEVFCKTFAATTGTELQLLDTDGAAGAAIGAGAGSGYYADIEEALRRIPVLRSYAPEQELVKQAQHAFERWKEILQTQLSKLE